MHDGEGQGAIARFEAQIIAWEAEASTHPHVFRRRLWRMAAFGVGYVIATLALAVIVGLAIIATSLAMVVYGDDVRALGLMALTIIPALLIWSVGRAMVPKWSVPDGIAGNTTDHARLLERVDELRVALDIERPIDQVLFTDMMGAAALSRGGFAGLWMRETCVLVGLPLLGALPAEEVDAVIAHELAHFSHGDDRVGPWLRQLVGFWPRMLSDLHGWGLSPIYRRFFAWYVPRFDALSVVFSREQEYRADQVAASVTSKEAAGSALVRSILGSLVAEEEFWPTIRRELSSAPEAPRDLMTRQIAAMREAPRAPSAARILHQQLLRNTQFWDSHPELTDRTARLGVRPTLPAPAEQTAAEVYLGESFDKLVAVFDEQEHRNIAAAWEAAHEHAAERAMRVSDLNARLDVDELDPDGVWELIGLVESDADRLALLEHLIGLAGDLDSTELATEARYYRGVLRLRAGEREGVDDVSEAIAADDGYLLHGSEAIADYMFEYGEPAEAQEWLDRRAVILRQIHVDHQERTCLLDSDNIDPPPELSLDLEVAFHQELDRVAGHQAAWLAVKRTTYRPEVPVFIVGLDRRFLGVALTARIPFGAFEDFPHCVFIVDFNMGTKLGRKVRKAATRLR